MNIRNTGNGNDGTDAGFLYFYFIEPIKFIKLAYLDLDLLFRLMVIADDNILIYLNGSVINLAHTDTTNIFIIVNGTDECLGTCIGIALRGRDIV